MNKAVSACIRIIMIEIIYACISVPRAACSMIGKLDLIYIENKLRTKSPRLLSSLGGSFS